MGVFGIVMGMGLLITFTAGLIIWIVLWSLGAQGLDAFLITILLTTVAAAGRLFSSFAADQSDQS